MWPLLAIAVFLFPVLVSGQKNINLGQGVLHIDFEKEPALLFYTDTTESAPTRVVRVTKDKEGGFVIKNNAQVKTWFAPEGLWPDYSIFMIRVDTAMSTWYKVVTHNEKGTTLGMKRDPVKKFIPWTTFLVEETTAIDKHEDFALEIKAAPSPKAATLKKMEKTDCFRAIEIRGDWLRVKTNELLECDQSDKKIKSGWIRWRWNNRLTIRYGVTC